MEWLDVISVQVPAVSAQRVKKAATAMIYMVHDFAQDHINTASTDHYCTGIPK